jgi:superfamily II DNA/RNA helicase
MCRRVVTGVVGGGRLLSTQPQAEVKTIKDDLHFNATPESFAAIGLSASICQALKQMKITAPSRIQSMVDSLKALRRTIMF